MLHDPGHWTCSAAAFSVEVHLSVVSQLLKSAMALSHARGQEHPCPRHREQRFWWQDVVAPTRAGYPAEAELPRTGRGGNEDGAAAKTQGLPARWPRWARRCEAKTHRLASPTAALFLSFWAAQNSRAAR